MLTKSIMLVCLACALLQMADRADLAIHHLADSVQTLLHERTGGIL